MPVSQNCQTVVIKSDKCCYKTTVETVAGNEDINNVTFPDNPNAYDHHIVHFDDVIVIYQFFGGSWSSVFSWSSAIVVDTYASIYDALDDETFPIGSQFSVPNPDGTASIFIKTIQYGVLDLTTSLHVSSNNIVNPVEDLDIVIEVTNVSNRPLIDDIYVSLTDSPRITYDSPVNNGLTTLLGFDLSNSSFTEAGVSGGQRYYLINDLPSLATKRLGLECSFHKDGNSGTTGLISGIFSDGNSSNNNSGESISF